MPRLSSLRTIASTLCIVLCFGLTSILHADVTGLRIGEIGFACRSGAAGTHFIEITAIAPGQSRDADLHLEVMNVLGQVSSLDLDFASQTAEPFAQGSTWLLAGGTFAASAGMAADGVAPTLDRRGGALALFTYDLSTGERVDLDWVEWGMTAGTMRAPYNGQSLVRVGDAFTRVAFPVITRADGTTATSGCYGYEPATAWVIDELFLRCATTAKGVRYVELRSTGDQSYDEMLVLSHRRAGGSAVFTVRPFASLVGSSAAMNSTFLAGSSPFTTASGIALDLTLTSLIDSLGGSLTLAMPNSGGDSLVIIQELRFGTNGTAALPVPGNAIQRQADGSYRSDAAPTPRNRAGGTLEGDRPCFGAPPTDLSFEWRIQEMALDCPSTPATAYIELVSLKQQPRSSAIGLRAYGADGALRFDLPSCLIGANGSAGPGTTSLLAEPGFRAMAWLDPDRTLDAALDPIGGRIELYGLRANAADSLLHVLRYGTVSGGLPLPTPGGCLTRVPATDGFTSTVAPSPTTTGLGTARYRAACFGPTDAGLDWVIDEMGLRCVAAPFVDGSFIELRSLREQPRRTDIVLRMYDPSQRQFLQILNVLEGAPEVALADQRQLLAGPSFAASTRLTPNLMLPGPVDQIGARIELTATTAAQATTVLARLDYGTYPGGLPLPAEGTSLQRQLSGDYAPNALANPQNRAMQTSTLECYEGILPPISVLISEVGLRCTPGLQRRWFIELQGRESGGLLDARTYLRVRAANGTLLLDIPLSPSGDRPLAPGQHLLIGPSTLATDGVPADIAVQAVPDSVSGTIELYRRGLDGQEHRWSYLDCGALAPPIAGGSYVALDSVRFRTTAEPTPRNSAGLGPRPDACFGAPVLASFAINELGTRCTSGAASFLEIVATVAGTVSADCGLRVRDAGGGVIADVPSFFVGYIDSAMSVGRTLLIGSDGFAGIAQSAADLHLPVELDPAGGSVELYAADLGGSPGAGLLASLQYGNPQLAAPLPGRSLIRTGPGEYVETSRPTPTGWNRLKVFAACYTPVDTMLRIDAIAGACATGKPDYGYVQIRSLDPAATVLADLGVRLYDGAGNLMADHPHLSRPVAGSDWVRGKLLAGTAGFAANTNVPADVSLLVAPPMESGTVELYWYDATTGLEHELDRWSYGHDGEPNGPFPGAALIRNLNFGFILSNTQFTENLRGQYGGGPCSGYRSPTSFYVRQLGLQCVDGSLAGQYVELQTTQAVLLDPTLGLEVLDANSQLLFRVDSLFGAVRWQQILANGSFLLAPSSAATLAGRTPDRLLPGSLDTLGGTIRLYQKLSTSARVVLSTSTYGTVVPGGLPPLPGYGLTLNPQRSVSRTPRSLSSVAWELPGCGGTIPTAARISELSLGCPYDPLDGSGQFIEIRNFGPDGIKPGGLWLELRDANSEAIRERIQLLAGEGGQPWAAGAHVLIARPSFTSHNPGLVPDLSLASTADPSALRPRLLWASTERYGPVVIDELDAGAAPRGQSIELQPDGVFVVRTIPTPHNAAGDSLTGPNSCLGGKIMTAPVTVFTVASGCRAEGSVTAFMELGQSYSSPRSTLRLRILDHTGAVAIDQGDLFTVTEPAKATGSANSSEELYFSSWLIGNVGFRAASGFVPSPYSSCIEKPLPIDPLGGEIILYVPDPGHPDIVSFRYKHGPLPFGGGFQRNGGISSPYPMTYAFQPQVRPGSYILEPVWTGSWSCYGDEYASRMKFLAAGATCANGDSSFRYIMMEPVIGEICGPHIHHCYRNSYLPHGVRLRTLDVNGAVLDSVTQAPAALWASPFRLDLWPGSVSAFTGVVAAASAPRMDPRGGTIQFVQLDPFGRAAAIGPTLAYGASSSSGGIYGPSPLNVPADPARPLHCLPCGATRITTYGPPVNTDPKSAHVQSFLFTAPLLDTITTTPAGSTARLMLEGSLARTNLSVRNVPRSIEPPLLDFSSTTEFVVNGLPAGQPLRIRARANTTGQGKVAYTSSYTGSPLADFTLFADAIQSQSRLIKLGLFAAPDTLVPFAETTGLTIDLRAGEPFRLSFTYQTKFQQDLRALDFDLSWTFEELPPGASVTSCHGFGGGPVPTQLALARAEAFEDHIELAWHGGAASEAVTLERREEAADWQRVADLLADGSGQLWYRDDAVIPGRSYDYRLRAADGHITSETRVTLPVSNTFTLTLEGGQPVRGPLVFAIARPAGTAAKLELFDVAGRLVASRQLAVSGPARERVTMAPGTSRAGIFLARLTRGSETRVLRVVLAP